MARVFRPTNPIPDQLVVIQMNFGSRLRKQLFILLPLLATGRSPSVPVNWCISSPRKQGFFRLLAESTGPKH